MTLPPVIHVTALRNAVTPAGEWTATARAASTPYVPKAAFDALRDAMVKYVNGEMEALAALAEAEARIKELEAGLWFSR